jgi:mRNA interferase HigB
MRVITRGTLVRYWGVHPETEAPLREWYRKAEAARWRNPAGVRGTFPQVDRVTVRSGNTLYVFNVGRAHRLVAAIHFDYPRVFVLRLMGHGEYDLDRWKDEL